MTMALIRSMPVVFAALLVGCGAAAARHVDPNVRASFSPQVVTPTVGAGTFVHPLASVIGAVELGRRVFVAPGASLRGDEGQPIHVGDESNLQDGVVLHALETFDEGHAVDANAVHVRGRAYGVYIGRHVSVAHQAQVHGPARVGDNTFVGMQALVFRAEVGANCVLEPRALVMGVHVADGRYVPAGQVVRTQVEADSLPVIDDAYPFARINAGVLHVNTQLADGYLCATGQ